MCTLFIGVTGVFQQGINTLVVILAMVLGAVLGEAVDLDRRVNALGKRIERRFKRPDGGKVTIAEGFVSASLLFCTGAMTIVGSLQSGLIDDHTTLFTKSLLDFVASIIFASSFGFGVLFAAGFVFVYQGLIAFVSYLVRGAFVDAAAGLTADSLTPFMTVVNRAGAADLSAPDLKTISIPKNPFIRQSGRQSCFAVVIFHNKARVFSTCKFRKALFTLISLCYTLFAYISGSPFFIFCPQIC